MRIYNAAAVASAIATRHDELVSLLSSMTIEQAMDGSLLPGWNRLTVICHLRYGAEANLSMTRAVLSGQTTSFYPEGRTVQRPRTLRPRPDEQHRDVVNSFATCSAELDQLWTSLDDSQWDLEAEEPEHNIDLGSISLGLLALLRLTEIEVHGTDLAIGASDWSDTFVDIALPIRARWLATRQSNHAAIDNTVFGTWILRPHDATPWVITAASDGVSVTEGGDDEGDAVIAGSTRDLLAFLLGRQPRSELSISGDRALAAAFKRQFPSP